MNETDIRKYAGLMRELGLTGLEITEDDKMVRLERAVSSAAKQTFSADVMQDAISGADTKNNSDCVNIKSPIVGVLYTSPAENAAPYVVAGDRVKKGQILCIVEAMKLMNEITAEEDGTIEEIFVTNGQVVEYGTELFRIKR